MSDTLIKTDKGNFKPLILKCTEKITDYAGWANRQNICTYNGSPIVSGTTEIDCSIFAFGRFRLTYSPFMGNIELLKNDSSSFSQTTKLNSSAYQSSGIAIELMLLNSIIFNTTATFGSSSGRINIATIMVITDDYDNAIIQPIQFVLPDTSAYVENTSNDFGYINGVPIDFIFSFPPIQKIIQNFSTTELYSILYNPPSDPYSEGGTSETGGGTGNFDLSSDTITVPNPPTLSAVDTGLVTLYTPTLAQMQALARYLWNADASTVEWWKKLIANPLDLILGLSIVPVAVPAGATENVRVGLIDTGVSMTKAANQYVQVDCGSLNVTEFYGAALDYLPFRKTSIYLPFIGTRSISTDDIMGKTVQVVYNIDLLSGALTAMIKCGDAVLYQYSGSCAMSIPLSGQTFTDMITSTIQLAAGIGATVASGGAAAGVVAASAANSVMSMKPTIERAGGVSGAAGQLAIMKPYMIGEIPRQSVPKDYNTFAGYPSNISALLGDLSGYTEIETIHIKGINATQTEIEEIETLLKEGVIL